MPTLFMQKATKKLPSKKKRRAPQKAYTGRLNQLQALKEELKEALEQQTAMSEVLRVIASSPRDVQSILDTVIANAVRLSGATKGHIRQDDGETQRLHALGAATANQRTVVVDHRSEGAGLGRRAAEHLDDLGREAARIARAAREHQPDRLGVLAPEYPLGQPRQLKEERVRGAQPLAPAPEGGPRGGRMRQVHHDQPLEWTDLLNRTEAGRIKVRDIASFGEDAAGELYIVSHTGSIWKLTRRQ